MRNLFSLLFVIFFTVTSAQQKYQSLLWKISHKDLPKDSYLYGTMHVSGKIAFNLDDVFYKSLLSVDAVALESDPTTWLEDSFDMYSSGRFGNLNAYAGGYYGQDDFYTELFGLEPVKRQSIRNFIRFDNSIINNFLYRKNRGLDNFEEETYLDMFIFQAGKKKEKAVISLEDFNESMMLTTRASFKSNKDKIDTWLQKRYKKENSFLLLENAYRARNLDLIDSIGVASNSDYYREHMLFIRNRNMVHVLDSVLQQKTVFAGVGAAHLPGENGMIELLRKRGYTVTALSSKKTNYGKTIKKKLEVAQLKPVLKPQHTADNFISINSFGKLQALNFANQKYYIATDMMNGGFLAITRINTFDYLQAKPKDLLKEINDLLYEDIPGQIVEKEMVSSPFPGIKILNKTKKNDYQRYLIYRTPLEIVIVKLGGKKDYVLKYGDEILGSIVFKKTDNNLTKYTSKYNKYSVEIPLNNISENTEHRDKKLIQAYDDNGFYFVSEAPIFDTDYIEEDSFEAKYITKAFFEKAQLTPLYGKYSNTKYSSYTSTAVVDSIKNKYLVLKSVVKDASYYLLGYAGKDTARAKTFFKSMNFHKKVNDKKYEIVKDTSLHFSVKTNVKPPMSFITDYRKDNEVKAYEAKTRKAQYVSRANELIDINRKKFHDLKMYENIDSLWAEVDQKYIGIQNELKNNKKYQIINRNKTHKDDVFAYTFTVKCDLSSKRILVKNILKKGTLFELKSLTDSVAGSSHFVETFFNTFTPKDTLLGRSPLTDKVSEFLTAMKNKDSISHNLYNSVVFRKKDVNALIDVVENVKFSEEDRFRRSFLMRKIIELDGESPRVIAFAKSMYEKSYSDPAIQLAILGELLEKNTLEYQELFLELLESDFPVGTSNIGIFNNGTFSKDYYKTKKKLFPEVLKYSSIKEYKKPIYDLLSQLVENDFLKIKVYKKYKDQLFNDARIELKRSFSDNSTRYNDNDGLTNYTFLLYPFKTEKKIQHWYDKLLESNDADALATYYGLLNKHKMKVPKKLKDTLFNNLRYFKAMIDEVAVDYLLPKTLNTKENKIKLAKAILFANAYNFDKLKVSFLKVEIKKVEEKIIETYFFKSKDKTVTRPNEEFSFIAFEQDEGSISVTPYYESSNNSVLNTTKSDKELIEEALDNVRYKNRKRLSRRASSNYLSSFK